MDTDWVFHNGRHKISAIRFDDDDIVEQIDLSGKTKFYRMNAQGQIYLTKKRP